MDKGEMSGIIKISIILLLLIAFILVGCSTSNTEGYVTQQVRPDTVNEGLNEPEPDETQKNGDKRTGIDKEENEVDPEAASIAARIGNMTLD